MPCEQSAALLKRGAPLPCEGGVLTHLRDRHSGAPQPFHEIEPTDVMLAVDPSAATVTNDIRY